MQVYIELAVAENFCMDYALLYCAKAVSKNPTPHWRIAVASVAGAGFAVVFPLFGIGAVWQAVLKIVSGFVICLIACKIGGIKSYLKFAGAFLIFTALLGGALIGAFSLTGLDYFAGQGYLLSSVPIGIPLFGVLMLILGAKRLAVRLSKTHKNAVKCRICAGESRADIGGFFDSGNKVYLHGQPVCVIPAECAEKLVDVGGIKEGVKIHTVAGSKTIKVFTADMEIDFGDRKSVFKGVKLGVSPNKIDRAVLHCDILE